MKKLSFLFVALALVGFITLSSCKGPSTPEEATEEATEEVVEEAAEEVEEAAEDVEAAAEDVMEEEAAAEEAAE